MSLTVLVKRPHDFRESLAASHAAADEPWWEECYRKAFPLFAAMIDHRDDGDHQRLGIDRTVVLASSKVIRIDEKVRYKDYGDVLLEYISNDITSSPGWAVKPLLCDYIAYAIKPTRRCLLLPVEQLQTAYKKNRDRWHRSYKEKKADNGNYCTLNIAIPETVLFSAIGSCLRVDWSEPEVFVPPF